MPEEEHDFFALLSLYFPRIFDVKYLMKSCKNLKGGLQDIADQMEVRIVEGRSVNVHNSLPFLRRGGAFTQCNTYSRLCAWSSLVIARDMIILELVNL